MNILFLVSVFFLSVGVKDGLVQLLTRANSIDEYSDVLDLIKRESLYKFIPHGMPIKGECRKTSSFGSRIDPFTKKIKKHSGIDFSARVATIVYATADGEITYCGRCSGYGNLIEITHKFGYKTRYGHLVEFYKKKGDFVKTGTPIGFVGNTGRSTGYHLHYEIMKNKKKINPYKYLKQ